MFDERRGRFESTVGSTSCSAQDEGRPSSHQPRMNHCASPFGMDAFIRRKRIHNIGEAHLDMLEVLELGDEGWQHALAQVACHQLSVHTSHEAQMMICALHNLQCIY